MSVIDRITVVVVSDNHYMVMLAALIKSIELTHKKNIPIDFYIVSDRINNKNKQRLYKSIDPKITSLYWINMSEVLSLSDAPPLDHSSFPLNIYARLFIPHFIPPHIKNVLYIDVDMIFQNDISSLWETDLQDKIIAAVIDKSEIIGNDWAGISNYKELGLSPKSKYFNSGLLLIDAIKWRNAEITNEIIHCIKKNIQYVDFPDQYGLNVIFANKWFELDPLWNVQSVIEKKNPYIIHFTGTKPIYNSYNNIIEYKELFYKYLRLTEWKNFTPISEYMRFIKRLYNKFDKQVWFLKRKFRLKKTRH